jgi:hypothetical protein
VLRLLLYLFGLRFVQILKQHMADKHSTCRQTLYDCFACDLQFSSRIERKRHIQSEHKVR